MPGLGPPVFARIPHRGGVTETMHLRSGRETRFDGTRYILSESDSSRFEKISSKSGYANAQNMRGEANQKVKKGRTRRPEPRDPAGDRRNFHPRGITSISAAAQNATPNRGRATRSRTDWRTAAAGVRRRPTRRRGAAWRRFPAAWQARGWDGSVSKFIAKMHTNISLSPIGPPGI